MAEEKKKEEKKKQKGGKKIKIEVSRLGFVFIILFVLCVLVWTFIIGVWMGNKLAEETKISTSEPEKFFTYENQTRKNSHEIGVSEKKIIEKKSEKKQTEKIEIKPHSVVVHKNLLNEMVSGKFESKEKKNKTHSVKKHHPVSRKKVKKVKTIYYSVQIGAFSKYTSAITLKRKFEKRGYRVFIKKLLKGKRILYRVLVGKFASLTLAKKELKKISREFPEEKPFVVKF